jgi:hypothetical protein
MNDDLESADERRKEEHVRHALSARLLPAARSIQRAFKRVLQPFLNRLRYLAWRFPALRVIAARIEMRRTDWGKRDPSENAETAPPPGEVVTLQGLWAMEFYTPSQAESLLAGFQKLKWDKVTSIGGDPVQWVRQNRSCTPGGGWFNLGMITRAGNEYSWYDARTAPLPDSVDYAEGAILTLTSSLTCVILFFVYRNPIAAQFQLATDTPRKTIAEPKGRLFSIHSPRSQKQFDVEAARTKARLEAWKWFRHHLPGVFCSEPTMPDEFPTSEFVTTELAQPFPLKNEYDGTRGFLDVLGLNHCFETWTQDSIPSLRFATRIRGDGFHTSVAVKIKDLQAVAKSHAFGEERSGWLYYADDTLQRILSRWGLVALLALLQKRVNTLRDSTSFRSEGRKKTLSTLTKLSEVEFRGLDVGAISVELQAFAKQPWFAVDVPDFKPLDGSGLWGNSFLGGIRARVIEQAKWLQRADEQVRRALSQQGNLIAARENIRLQRRVEALTAATALLTLIAILVAVLVPMATDPNGKILLAHWLATIAEWVSR